MTADYAGREVRFHIGGFAGAAASISFIPSEKIGVVVLHNESGLKANYPNSVISKTVFGLTLEQDRDKGINDARNGIADLVSRAADAHKRVAWETEERFAREWQLSFEAAAYAGDDVCPVARMVRISQASTAGFEFQWCNLKGERTRVRKQTGSRLRCARVVSKAFALM